jgi:hypothetical protein
MTRATLALLLALAAPPAFAQAASAPADTVAPPSEAEQLLFMKPWLASMREPRTLVYDYAALADGPTAAMRDHASLALVAHADGKCCGTHAEFLSGPLAIGLPDLDDPQGNPMLLYFLESEVRQMERSTKGQAAHFRRRIRQALADEAKVATETVRWNGKDVPARVVRVAPFVNDPYRQRFEREAATTYEFVLSDAVPGGIVRLSAAIPAAKAGDPPQAGRSLTLADAQPAPATRK